MSDHRAGAGLVLFGPRFAGSPAFLVLFRDGMTLVEETAAYLDGPGRREAKRLERMAALASATESMRLTTRLMQIASWLLLQRAVNEGEMSLAQATRERSKVKLASASVRDEAAMALLSMELRQLVQRSLLLQSRVRRLDATLQAEAKGQTVNPVKHQIGLLQAAFERRLRERSSPRGGCAPRGCRADPGDSRPRSA
jgi:regulator of CtrA degradation